MRSATSVAVSGLSLAHRTSITSSSASLMRVSIVANLSITAVVDSFTFVNTPVAVKDGATCRIFLRFARVGESANQKEWRKSAIYFNWHADCYYNGVHLVPRHKGAGSGSLVQLHRPFPFPLHRPRGGEEFR